MLDLGFWVRTLIFF